MVNRKQTFTKAILPQVMKKHDMALCIAKVVLGERYEGKQLYYVNNMAYTTIENNKLIRENREVFESMVDYDLIFEDTVLQVTKSFVPTSRIKPVLDIMQIEYGGSPSQRFDVLAYGIWVKRIGGTFDVVIRQTDESNAAEYRYVTLLDNIIVNEDEIGTYEHYSCLGNSPSGERRNMILVGNDKYDWETIIDNASDSFLTLNRGEKTYKEMAKESAKLFQCLAGSKTFGLCNRIAILFDKFNDDKFDGMCYGSSEALALHIKETFDIEVAPKALDGMFLQGRIAQGKYGCITIPNKMVLGKIRHLAKRNDMPTLEFSWEDMHSVSKDILSNPENYKGRVVVIGDRDKPIDILIDSNTLKSKYDYSKRPEYTILRVLKNDSPVHFSSTIFAKGIAKQPDLMMDISKKMFQYYIRDTARKQLKGKGRVLGLDTFDTDNIFMRDVLVGAFPEYTRRDANVALDCVKNIVEGANKAVQKLGFAAKGSGKGIVVGPENLVLKEQSLLGEFELYNKHFVCMFEQLDIPEEERYVVGFKYPTMDIDEYEIYNCLSLDTVKSRLDRYINNSNLRDNLKREYSMYQDSIAVMPATEVFKQKHAGSDFDTDMMQFLILITDHALEIIKEKHPSVHDEMSIYNKLWHVFKHTPVIIKIDQ